MSLRDLRRAMAQESLAYPEHLVPVHEADLQRAAARRAVGPKIDHEPIACLRSRRFMVQVYPATGRFPMRLTIQRTAVNDTGGWVDGITWDEMQRLKREAGYGELCAVEVYPPDSEVVNVANLRHLWLLPEPPPFMWRRDP